jgi:hypothetical protein
MFFDQQHRGGVCKLLRNKTLLFFASPPPHANGAKSASITCGGAPILSSPISPPLSARARSPSESASASSRRLRSNRSLPCVHWRRGHRDFRTTSPNRVSVSSRGEGPIVLIRLASCANKSLVPRIALIQWLVFALQAAVASRNRSLTTNLLCLDIFVPFSWK